MRLPDGSGVLASLHEAEPHHEACSVPLLQGGHALYVNALAEVFSTLTGGAQGLRVGAELAQRRLSKSGAEATVTLDVKHFAALVRQGDPRVEGV